MTEVTISKGYYEFMNEKFKLMLELERMYKNNPDDTESIIKFLHENT